MDGQADRQEKWYIEVGAPPKKYKTKDSTLTQCDYYSQFAIAHSDLFTSLLWMVRNVYTAENACLHYNVYQYFAVKVNLT